MVFSTMDRRHSARVAQRRVAATNRMLLADLVDGHFAEALQVHAEIPDVLRACRDRWELVADQPLLLIDFVAGTWSRLAARCGSTPGHEAHSKGITDGRLAEWVARVLATMQFVIARDPALASMLTMCSGEQLTRIELITPEDLYQECLGANPLVLHQGRNVAWWRRALLDEVESGDAVLNRQHQVLQFACHEATRC